MKKLHKIFVFALFSFLIIHCTLKFENCSAQWVQMSNGMGNISVWSLAYSGNNIFAGTYPVNGVYLSTNNGTSWVQTSLNNQTVYSLAVNGNNIFAGTGTGVYLSTNNCTSWTQTSLNNQYVYSLVVILNYVFAGTVNNGVYLSTNNGTSWTQTSLNNRTVWSLAVNGNNTFAGTTNYGVYLSTDNGTSWNQTSLNNRTVLSLAVNGNNTFAGTTNYGVYLSTDNGTSWTQTSLNNRSTYSLAVNVNNVFAGTIVNGVYVSNNNGSSWLQRNEGLGNLTIDALCILNNYIFAGTDVSVYRRPLGELITNIKPVSELISEYYTLHQNYPNPFNPSTRIKFSLPESGFTTLKVYNMLGKEVATLVNESLKPGTYEVDWNASQYSSGVYFYKLEAGDFRETKRMMLTK
jgi:hypothetical protein